MKKYAFATRSEEEIVNAAIELDQATDPTRRAGARALRGIVIPYSKWMDDEIKRWNSQDDMAATLEALTKTVGSIISSAAMTAAAGDTTVGASLAETLADHAVQSIRLHVKKMSEMAKGGTLTSDNFKVNS